MRTWNDYKEHVREVDPIAANDINEIENIASIVGALIEQRTALGISQRELASLCGIPGNHQLHVLNRINHSKS